MDMEIAMNTHVHHDFMRVYCMTCDDVRSHRDELCFPASLILPLV
jgi:hypothetical protein